MEFSSSQNVSHEQSPTAPCWFAGGQPVDNYVATPLSSPVDLPFNTWGGFEDSFHHQRATDSGEGLGPLPVYHQNTVLHQQQSSQASWNENDWSNPSDGQLARQPFVGTQANAHAQQANSEEKDISSLLSSNGNPTRGSSMSLTSSAAVKPTRKAKWGDSSGPYKRKTTSRVQNSPSDDDNGTSRQRGQRKRNSHQMRNGYLNKSSSPESSPSSSNATANNNRTSHNLVEKQYRTRLNDQFDFLLSSIPSDLVGHHMNGPERGDRPEKRISKADVLALAKKHIENLEKGKREVEEENVGLKRTNKQLNEVWMNQNGGSILLNGHRG